MQIVLQIVCSRRKKEKEKKEFWKTLPEFRYESETVKDSFIKQKEKKTDTQGPKLLFKKFILLVWWLRLDSRHVHKQALVDSHVDKPILLVSS